MSYQRTIYDARPPHEIERLRSSWDSLQRPHYSTGPSPSHYPLPGSSLFDPESDSSDISDTPREDPHSRVYSGVPTPLPPLPPSHTLESLEAIEARLRDLQHVEDLNIKKQDYVKAKRARKDDRIRRKREEQDVKIKAIMDARARRDDRISRRRRQEDDAFDRFDQDLEQEENSLRRRQKRLKRGLPVEDVAAGSRISSASMSPPGPGYSSVPPPAKRHQAGPPGQMNSPVASTPRPTSHAAPSAPNSAGANPPPYAFLQSGHHHHHHHHHPPLPPPPQPPPSSAAPAPPYGRSPTVAHSPLSTPGAFQPIPRSHQPAPEPATYGVNGHPSSPHLSRPQIPSPSAMLNTAPPPRQQPSSNYDTRPPPPAAVPGFASINTPPASGFAPINPRSTATPPAQVSVPAVKNADHERNNGHVRSYPTDGTPSIVSGSTSSKRTPSTTHPYQMSEAFANRHHHCERTDHLNRGIWTSYGAGGTKEMPTGPAQEMYLRCNHDGCRRIDWRTVHGLQCHIVKNHEQPKGTIGSLEKALDRYGVPVAEVVAYERDHGEGTGGTMADPKNLKLKAKSSQPVGDRGDAPRRSYGTQQGPDAYKQKLAMSFGNSPPMYQGSPASQRSLPQEGTDDSETESKSTPANIGAKPPAPTSGFAAVNGAWSGTPTFKRVEPGDQVMTEAPASPLVSAPNDASVRRDAPSWNMWPQNSENEKAESVPQTAPTTIQGPTLAYGPPASDSTRPSTEGTPTNNRSQFVSIVSASQAAPQGSVVNHSEPSSKPEQFPSVEQTQRDNPITVTATASAAPEKPVLSHTDATEDGRPTKSAAQEPELEASSLQAQDKESAFVQGTPKETENIKAEAMEAVRTESRILPNVTRRASIVGVRRGSSRRASVAANRAEREYEKEREGAVARVEAEAEVEAESKSEVDLGREKEKDNKDERDHSVDAAQVREDVTDGDRGKEDGDDGDTITAAPPSPVSKDKEKEKEKEKEREREKEREAKDIKTTPRRMTNGRVLRKNR